MTTPAPPAHDPLQLSAQVPADGAGLRLDAMCARLFDDHSRSRLQRWIADGRVRVNGVPVTLSRHPVEPGDRIDLRAEPQRDERVQPEDIALDVVWFDRDLAVINKPAGLTVHPGAGQRNATLQNALLARFAQTAAIPRAGIVHRLDKDTSGLLVVALSLEAHTRLVAMTQERSMSREYDAVVQGALVAGGTIDAPLGRHPRDRLRQAVVEDGRAAVTHYRVQARFARHSHLRVRLETGRTHQIRVHLEHIRHPIVGDPLYGGQPRTAGLPQSLRERVAGFPRQALHARALGLAHPRTGEALSWTAEPPRDMQELLAALKAGA